MAPTKSSKDKHIQGKHTQEKHIWPKLTTAQKIMRCQKFVDLTDAIRDARESYQKSVKTISEKHRRQVSNIVNFYFYLPGKRSERWTRQQIFLGRVHQRANPWNAWFNHQTTQNKNVLNI
jgi:hypothetical protein